MFRYAPDSGAKANVAGLPRWADAVEKGFLALERGKAFQKQANIENIDSCTLDLGFYYCPHRPFAGS
jgi:hypothetical protein